MMEESHNGVGKEGPAPSSQNSIFPPTPLSRMSLSSLSPHAVLSQRIVNIEHYMSPPVKEFDNTYSDFRHSAVKRVPIIRIFGATPAGQKMCANIHGVYPYVSVLDDPTVEGLDYRIAAALDGAINDSILSNKGGNAKGHFSPPTQHVFKVIRVVGKTFYGYRSSPEVFLRIFFYNPLIIKKAVDLLQSGSILGRSFQPYEAHVPYNLQFMIDYGLYGMNFAHYASVKFRKNDDALRRQQRDSLKDLLPSQSASQESNNSASSFNLNYVDPDSIEEHLLSPPQLLKQTLCELEVDVIATDIIISSATSTGKSGKSENPGIDSIWKDEMERRRQHGVDDCSQISVPQSQERERVPLVQKTEETYQQQLWSKVENYFADNEMDFGQSEEFELSKSIVLEDSSFFVPSSQVTVHQQSQERANVQVGSASGDGDEEFIKLLEEMANEYQAEVEELVEEISDFDEEVQDMNEDGADLESEDNANWDDTLLSQTLLQKISEAEAFYEEGKARELQKEVGPVAEAEVEGNRPKGISMFQCDGQGNEPDSPSRSSRSKSLVQSKAEQSATSTTRASRRSSRRMSGAQDQTETKTASDSSKSSSNSHSPAVGAAGTKKHRLSLTYKRLARSRSQDGKKAECETDKILATSNSEPANLKTAAAEIKGGKYVKSLASVPESDTEKVKGGIDKEKLKRNSRITRRSVKAGEPSDNKIISKPSDLKSEPSSSTNSSSATKTPTESEASSNSPMARRSLRNTPAPTARPETLEPNSHRKLTGFTEAEKQFFRRSPILCLEKIKVSLPSSTTTDVPATTSKRERKIPKRFLYKGEFEVSLPGAAPDSQGSNGSLPKTEDKQKATLKEAKTKSDGKEKQAESKDKPKRTKSEDEQKPEVVVTNATSGSERASRSKSRNSTPFPTPTKELESKSTSRKSESAVKSDAKRVEVESNSEQQGREHKLRQLAAAAHSSTSLPIRVTRRRSVRKISNDADQSDSSDHRIKSATRKNSNASSTSTSSSDRKLTRSGSFISTHKEQAKSEVKKADEKEINGRGGRVATSRVASVSGEKRPIQIRKGRKRLGMRVHIPRGRGIRSSQATISPASSKQRTPTKAEVKMKIELATCGSLPEPLDIFTPEESTTGGIDEDLDPAGSLDNAPSTSPSEGELEPVPATPMPSHDQYSNTESRAVRHIGVVMMPQMETKGLQTDSSITKNAAAQVKVETSSSATQVPVKISVTVSTQTEMEFSSIEVQTEAVAPLCLCQCTCVVKPMSDAAIDSQEDLKPELKNQKIQVDNVDMITAARNARFTTPQSNRMRSGSKTPSRSPEKRRVSRDTPLRRSRSLMTPCHGSRYLQALGMKTPVSGNLNRFRGFGQTPTPPSKAIEINSGLTPPSRESKEIYLTKVISSQSPTHKKRLPIKPRNLQVETSAVETYGSNQDNCAQDWAGMPPADQVTDANASVLQQPIIPNMEEIHSVSNGCNNEDLSINSIYEYEEVPEYSVVPQWDLEMSQDESQSFTHVKSPLDIPLPGLSVQLPYANGAPGTPETPSEVGTPPSVFQQKRTVSRQRTRYRIERRRAANIEANRGIKDVFQNEVDPLKPAPSYKSLTKWLEMMKATPGALEKLRRRSKDEDEEDEEEHRQDKWFRDDSSSDEEELPKVKLFGGGGGGNVSDGSSSSDSDSSSSSEDEGLSISNKMKTFTPPDLGHDQFIGSQEEVEQQAKGSTPSSILRSGKGTPSSSRRLSGASFLKRKIRWEDDAEEVEGEPSHTSSRKRIKLDNGTDPPSSQESFSVSKSVDISELDGPSFKNTLGLENSISNLQDCKALQTCQFLTSMCIELHCASRQGLTPDPKVDPILGIFILVSSDYPDGFRRPSESLSLLIFDADKQNHEKVEHLDHNQKMMTFSSEELMIEAFIDLVRYWDPDIFVGYEVEKSSFGYLIQRGFQLGKDMASEMSRVLPPPARKQGENQAPMWRPREEWNGMISGRIVLNLWRLLRHEISVQSYTFENAAYHILRRRVYKFPFITLASYWDHRVTRDKVIQYYTIRIKGVVQIMEKLDLINRTSELARLFGIQFYEVLSRGSQYRVEGMMLRATKSQDFIAPSPGIMQRAKMRAPEYLPLILEPKSNFYTDPVAVLDFQSLYPSMMIAYNYDYASALGRVEHLGTMESFPFGCLDLQVPPVDLQKLRNHIHVSPCGVAFVDKSLVRGVVPEMLEQILETRQMVKRSMKRWKNEGASLHKVLDSRQLGLKLIANVTYGYTSANFSGRMPCVDIADSIVSKGRETLQRAIDHVKDNFHRWGGEVVYGDTDSMFILFKGRSREEAFKLAYEIADEVTQLNPKPVKLKFEKIYQPCILQSKKRYVGFAYESPDQLKPSYDAKGIETVRRDGCPAIRKILERTLHILFSMEKSKVEEYVKLQFEKLFKGRVSMQDYVFAREFRGRAGYKPGASVPSLEIAKRISANDPRAEPLVKERVPYVVTYGSPSLPLIKLVRTPEEFFNDSSLRLNAHYYIEKVIIPALNRCLLLAKMDATKWYLQLPRKYLRNVLDQPKQRKLKTGQATLDNFVIHQNCMRCGGRTAGGDRGLCEACLEDKKGSALYLMEVLNTSRTKLEDCREICQNCSGERNKCISVDCPILHKLTRYQRDQPYMTTVEKEVSALEW